MVGVKKDFDAGLSAGDMATFEAIAIGPDGDRVARQGAAGIYQVTNDYQWFNADGRWSYQPVKSSKRIASGTIEAVGADMAARLSARVGWGAHRLDIKTLDGEETSVAFDIGWSGRRRDTPDNVVVTLDKTNYAAGEQAKLRIASAFAGKATVALVGTQSSASSTSISSPATLSFRSRSGPDESTAPMRSRSRIDRSMSRPGGCPAARSASPGSPSTATRTGSMSRSTRRGSAGRADR